MDDAVKRPPRPTLRVEQARRTRRAVLDAARERFLRDGYAATTMAHVAADAGVSVETVYKNFGNKAKLLKAVFDVTIAGDDEPVPVRDREAVAKVRAEPDGRRKLEMYAHHITAIGQAVGPLLLVVRDAAATNPDAAELWQALQSERLMGMTLFAQHLGQQGHLRTGVTVAEAADIIWACNSLETWDLFMRQRGWNAKRLGRLLSRQLAAALLTD